MATEGVNINEDAEMAECDGDKVVTMMDVLQEQQDFEEDANAVLGASDDKNCTYSKGYIKRQALYACLTCCTDAKTDPTKRAGVCLACSLNCHENHELIELYTKRNFRCDCGNPKFNSHPCQYTQDKTDLNDDNVYNQNFSGLYCICQRPYPDPESTVEEDMIQCIICEDWLHASHLEAVVPPNDQYSEMICKSCMEKNEFLHDYSLFAVTVEAGDVDVVTVNGECQLADVLSTEGLEKEKLVNGIEENKSEVESNANINGDVKGDVDMDEKQDKKVKESIAPELNEESKQEDLDNVESTEPKTEDKENADKSIGLDTETQKTEQAQNIPINESVENDKKNEEMSVDNAAKPNEESLPQDKCDAAELTGKDDPDQIEKTVSSEEKEKNIDDNMESTEIKLQDTDSSKELTPSVQQSTKDESSTDDVQENITESNERNEDQLLDDLSALSDNNLTTEGKPEENSEKNNDGTNNKDEQTNDTATIESGDNTEEKQITETENSTNDVKVPDTSQMENNKKETTEDKTDSVMDAIDELLQTANKAQESETAESNKEVISETTENIEQNEDKTNENDTNEKTSNSIDKDIEMSDTTNQNKVEDIPTVESDSKDITETDVNNTEAPVNEDKVDNEAPKLDNENSEINDASDENISKENEGVNETEEESKVIGEGDEEDNLKITEPSMEDGDEKPVAEHAKEHKRKLSTDLTVDTTTKKAKLECIRPKGVKRIHKGATFWPSHFRQKLCTCGECISMYKDLKVLFLTDLEDTVSAYESLGKENVAGAASQYEKGLQALSSLDRIQQINALTEYNKMRDKLLDFLKSFKDRKEIVKEEDIKAFFAEMKPRREPDGVYFCR